jgi:hypothetical protein
MKQKDPDGHPVMFYFSNADAFNGRRAKPELLAWMKEHCGPVGVLWKTRWTPEGFKIFFLIEIQAVHAALRWGGA